MCTDQAIIFTIAFTDDFEELQNQVDLIIIFNRTPLIRITKLNLFDHEFQARTLYKDYKPQRTLSRIASTYLLKVLYS